MNTHIHHKWNLNAKSEKKGKAPGFESKQKFLQVADMLSSVTLSPVENFIVLKTYILLNSEKKVSF